MTASKVGVQPYPSFLRHFKPYAITVIANDQGNRTTPSYVAFSSDERLIGDAAKNQAAMNPKNTVFDAKRLIGRRFDDADVKKDMKVWPFEVIDKDGAPAIQVEYLGETRQFTPAEISAMVLSKLKETAEAKVSLIPLHYVCAILIRLLA